MGIGSICGAGHDGCVSCFKFDQLILKGHQFALAQGGKIFGIENEQYVLLSLVRFEGEVPYNFPVDVSIG